MKRAEVTEGQYHSPLRKAQAAATRDQILDAVATVFERGEEPTYAVVAAAAGVQERTVYRYFPTKDELHRAFWRRVHEQRIGVGPEAVDLPSLLQTVADSFRGFAGHAALVRGMLHSAQGRAIRLSANDQRRRRFERVAAAELPQCGLPERRRVAAAAQVLCSAMAWEYLQDYWGMSADEAIATVQDAVTAMLRGWRAPRAPVTKRKDDT
jgi:AcrR family transcriptional regulator